jgi:hypothetical protein
MKFYVINPDCTDAKQLNTNAPWFKGRYSSRIKFLKNLALKLLDYKLKRKFGKGLDEFNSEYLIWPMCHGYPRICVRASNASEAVKKVREDMKLISYLIGLQFYKELKTYPYPYTE